MTILTRIIISVVFTLLILSPASGGIFQSTKDYFKSSIELLKCNIDRAIYSPASYFDELCGLKAQKSHVLSLLENQFTCHPRVTHRPQLLFFTGPPGVGKSLMARSLSQYYSSSRYFTVAEIVESPNKSIEEIDKQITKSPRSIIFLDDLNQLGFDSDRQPEQNISPLAALKNQCDKKQDCFFYQLYNIITKPISHQAVFIFIDNTSQSALESFVTKHRQYYKAIATNQPDLTPSQDLERSRKEQLVLNSILELSIATLNEIPLYQTLITLFDLDKQNVIPFTPIFRPTFICCVRKAIERALIGITRGTCLTTLDVDSTQLHMISIARSYDASVYFTTHHDEMVTLRNSIQSTKIVDLQEWIHAIEEKESQFSPGFFTSGCRDVDPVELSALSYAVTVYCTHNPGKSKYGYLNLDPKTLRYYVTDRPVSLHDEI